MVLFKRKQVQFLPAPEVDDDQEVHPPPPPSSQLNLPPGVIAANNFVLQVWHIPQTGEVFVTYEDYLTRMDFYKQVMFKAHVSRPYNR